MLRSSARVRVLAAVLGVPLAAVFAKAAIADASADARDGAADAEPIRVVVHAPARCRDAAARAGNSRADAERAFLDAVKERTTRVREAREGEPARLFRVDIKMDKRGASGQLIVEDADGGASPPRVLRGQNCAGVEAALELIVALAVDPNAQMNIADAGSTDAAPTDATGADDAAIFDAGEPVLEAAASLPAPVDAPVNEAGQIVIAPAPDRPPPLLSWHDAVGAGIDFVGTGNAPVTTGAHLFVATSREPNGLFAPSLRLNAAYFETTIAPAATSNADLGWLLLSADLCPLRVPFGADARFAFVPCAFGEAGATRFFTGGLPDSDARTRPWLAFGPSARLEVAVAGPFFAEVTGTMRVPLVRDRFTFNPGIPVYRAPVVMLGSGIDVGVRFR